VMKFHQWILEERDKLAARAANPAEGAKVGAALSPPEQKDRRVITTCITPAGMETLKALDRPIEEFHRHLLGHLGESRLHSLIRLLEAARKQEG